MKILVVLKNLRIGQKNLKMADNNQMYDNPL